MFRFLSTDIPAPLRLRRWLIARRWCFFILLSLGVLAFLFWGISSHNLFLRISVWRRIPAVKIMCGSLCGEAVTYTILSKYFSADGDLQSLELSVTYRL